MARTTRTKISRLLAAVALTAASAVVATSSPASATRTLNTVWFGYPTSGITIFGSESADTISVSIPTGDNSRIVFQTANASSMTIADQGSFTGGPQCRLDDSTHISCPKFAHDTNNSLVAVNTIDVEGWGGADQLSLSGFGTVYQSTQPIQATLSGWEGNDTLTATGGYSWIVGGSGDDTITSGPGSTGVHDQIYGGAGNDTIDTETNSSDVDTIYCDDQVDVVPNPDTYLSDSLNKDSGDNVGSYFVYPNSYPSGCDTIS